MQEKNVVTIDYLGDPERFADFLNALWFSGNRILTSVNIRECKADSSRIWKESDTLHTSEVFRDLTREVSLGHIRFWWLWKHKAIFTMPCLYGSSTETVCNIMSNGEGSVTVTARGGI